MQLYHNVFWNPEKLRLLNPSLPCIPDNPVRLPSVQSPSKQRNSTQELEVKGQRVFLKGSNLVNDEELTVLEAHPFFASFTDIGAIHVIRANPDPDFQPTGTTLDFNEHEAQAIVSESLDNEWLNLCINSEAAARIQGRASEKIIEACRKQIKRNEGSAKRTSMAAIANSEE